MWRSAWIFTGRHVGKVKSEADLQGFEENIPEEVRENDVTLAEWIRHCKRSGLYKQGKLLYKEGGLNLDNLHEEVMVNIEKDYQVCVRMLERTKSTS